MGRTHAMELEARHASPIGKSRLTGGLQNTLTPGRT
jgi:hypothetical protein